MGTKLLISTIIALTSCIAATAQPAPVDLPLTPGANGWVATVEGAGSVVWGDAGAAPSVVLTPGGGFAGISAPLPAETSTGMLAIRVSLSSKGGSNFEAYLTPVGEAPTGTPVWAATITGNKQQNLAAHIAPPATGQALSLHLGARSGGVLTLKSVAIFGDPAPPPASAPETTSALPPGWEPEGNLDATERALGNAVELQAEVKGVRVSYMHEATCALGTYAPIMVLVDSPGDAKRTLDINGDVPEALAFDSRSFPITKKGLMKAALRVQALLPGSYWGRVIISIDDENASIPVHITATRGYPAFGVSPTPGSRPPGPWQLREMVVSAGPETTAEEILAQVEPRLSETTAIPALHFDGLPPEPVLREVVAGLAGKIGLYGPAWRPDRPFAGADIAAEATRLVDACKLLRSAIGAEDMSAAIVSPMFDSAAADADSAERVLLDTCLGLRMGDHFNALALSARPLPPGGVLGESLGGKNLRSPSPFWAGLDLAQSHGEVEALLATHQVRVPILTSGVGGPASVDERVDGLKLSRAMVLAAYAGATGATFSQTQSATEIGLEREDGEVSPSGWAVRELSRELTGAAPIMRSWTSKEIPGTLGEAIVALPFVRGRETVLVLWNNSYVTRNITLTLTTPPISEHVLTISRDDPFVEREYHPHFTFSKEAIKARSQDVYLQLEPLQLKVFRYRMRVALPTWVDSLGFTARAKDGAPGHGRDVDDRTWWQKLRDWADGNE